MAKRMTVVFDDEELYTAVKIEAVRRGVPAKDLISEAVKEWLETQEDLELAEELEASREELLRVGGAVDAAEFFSQLRREPEN